LGSRDTIVLRSRKENIVTLEIVPFTLPLLSYFFHYFDVGAFAIGNWQMVVLLFKVGYTSKLGSSGSSYRMLSNILDMTKR